MGLFIAGITVVPLTISVNRQLSGTEITILTGFFFFIRTILSYQENCEATLENYSIFSMYIPSSHITWGSHDIHT